MTFERFDNRVNIRAKLVAITPIFIGAQADSFKPGEVNGACVKDSDGKPYIPGSSLKGVLRAFLSSVSADQSCEKELSNSEKVACRKTTDDFLTKEQRDEEVRKAKEKEKYKGMKDDEILADLILEASNKVERLFGSQVMAGKVKIADAMPIEDHVVTEVRNGVAIDRDTHTALSGALFDTEVVAAGTAFQFIASAENLTPDEADLFGQLMEYFAEGNITVGGRSRAGLGYVELKDVRVWIYHASESDFPAPEEIKDGLNGINGKAVCKCSKH